MRWRFWRAWRWWLPPAVIALSLVLYFVDPFIGDWDGMVAAVPTEPMLVSRGADGVVAAADGAGALAGRPTQAAFIRHIAEIARRAADAKTEAGAEPPPRTPPSRDEAPGCRGGAAPRGGRGRTA